jgi:hypothetical protein
VVTGSVTATGAGVDAFFDAAKWVAIPIPTEAMANVAIPVISKCRILPPG